MIIITVNESGDSQRVTLVVAFGFLPRNFGRNLCMVIGGSKGGRQGRAPPTGSKFFHFHAVFSKNLKNNSNFGSWRTPWGKSWIRH